MLLDWDYWTFNLVLVTTFPNNTKFLTVQPLPYTDTSGIKQQGRGIKSDSNSVFPSSIHKYQDTNCGKLSSAFVSTLSLNLYYLIFIISVHWLFACCSNYLHFFHKHPRTEFSVMWAIEKLTLDCESKNIIYELVIIKNGTGKKFFF